MISRLSFLYIFFIMLSAMGVWADRPNLEEDITDGYLDEYSKIEAAFILSGVTDPDSLRLHLDWYDQLLKKLKSFSYDLDDPVGSARTIFMYLHNEWLKTYALESTTLADIVRNKEYNCVAATILFNIICEDFSWDVQAFETPTHVYTIFNRFRDDLFVENTKFPEYDNKETRQLIANEIDRQLENRGLKTNVMKPQLQAGFRIIVSQEDVIFTDL